MLQRKLFWLPLYEYRDIIEEVIQEVICISKLFSDR